MFQVRISRFYLYASLSCLCPNNGQLPSSPELLAVGVVEYMSLVFAQMEYCQWRCYDKQITIGNYPNSQYTDF